MILLQSRKHLGDLIEACQRCAWHACRSLRNRVAHDYGTDFELTAGYFNALHDQLPVLSGVTWARTVRSEMPSSRAISSLLNPWRMRPSTSSSRWEIRPPVGLG